MSNIYNYLNYRDYLKDFYNDQKAKNSRFSYQLMANKIGFKSKTILHYILDGKRNISEKSIFRFNQLLQLEEKAFTYFRDIVAFNQATSNKQQNYFFNRLTQGKPNNSIKRVFRDQYEFYSKWYHPTIRELITMVNTRDDFKRIARLIKPAISPRQVSESIKLLLRLSLIKKTANGYAQTNKIITSGNEVQSLAIQNFHIQNMVLASESIDTVPSNERDISCLVIGLDKKGFENIKSYIQKVRNKILKDVEKIDPADSVYHLSIQMFPTAKKEIKEVTDE